MLIVTLKIDEEERYIVGIDATMEEFCKLGIDKDGFTTVTGEKLLYKEGCKSIMFKNEDIINIIEIEGTEEEREAFKELIEEM